ncbi:3-coathanger stack domain-containing protein [Emticicia sp. C21]|uniref:3-coathanger stack domain-containing protein n=1 Tax=Emticicia sp. C21 TaxID=2302915 RepID=UPI000E35353E|nr:3-coathanger stack domain-containing protein [Emticicia sp. C21]RFS13855.1 hypothetical protein D0T08_24280 [Emticicia sp. C21]
MLKTFTLLAISTFFSGLCFAFDTDYSFTNKNFKRFPHKTSIHYRASKPFIVPDTLSNPVPISTVMSIADKDTLFKVWDKIYGGSNDEAVAGITKTSDGNFILLCASGSLKSGNKISTNADDYWVIKVDRDGNKLWEKTYGGGFLESPSEILALPNNEFMLIGTSISDIGRDKTTPRLGNPDYEDIWVVKIDGNGNKLWDRTFGSSDRDGVAGAVITLDGNVVLAGTRRQSDNYDYQIIKININGDLLWQRFFTGDSYDSVYCIAQSSDNGVIVSGYSDSGVANNKSAPSKGGYDYWVLKIDGNGDKVWDKAFGGSGYDVGNAILKTNDNFYYLLGTSSSPISGDKSKESYGGEDIWVVKINENGDKIWDRTFGGLQTEQFVKGLVLPNNSFIVGCETYSSNSGEINEPMYATDNMYVQDIWIVKVDSEGNKKWNKRIGGTKREGVGDFLLISEDEFFLTGRSMSNIGFDKTSTSWNLTNCTGFNCGDDSWLVKYKLKNKTDSPVTINKGQTINLITRDCYGSVTWSNGMSGVSINVTPQSTITYTATCNVYGSTTISSIVVNVTACGNDIDLVVSENILAGTPLNPVVKTARNSITATNSIGTTTINASAKYIAENSITLSQGFKVEAGSVFQTKISPGCN